LENYLKHLTKGSSKDSQGFFQRISKSRIKRWRGVNRRQYRLRIGEIRVFYDIVEATVEVLAIIPKSKAAEWLENIGGEE